MFPYPWHSLVLKHLLKEQPGSSMTKNAKDRYIPRDTHSFFTEGVQTKPTNIIRVMISTLDNRNKMPSLLCIFHDRRLCFAAICGHIFEYELIRVFFHRKTEGAKK